jgi:hypothetical protein
LHLLQTGLQPAALAVNLEDSPGHGIKAAPGKCGIELLWVVADEADVMHGGPKSSKMKLV